jgi:hypothetical protein
MRLTKQQFCKLAVEGKLKIKVPMSKLNDAFGIIFYKVMSDKKDLIECTIEQYHGFKIEEGYKVILKAKDERYGSESFYISDLLGLIDNGYVKCSIVQ